MPEKILKVGDPAPIFSLLDETGQEIRLADYLGKQPIILFFYPGDFTPGCTLQLSVVRDDWAKFKALNLAVFGINQADAASHLSFKEKHGFPFPLLVDESKAVSRAYGALRKMFKATVIRRSVVGIDLEGKIRYLKRGLPRDQEILKAMK